MQEQDVKKKKEQKKGRTWRWSKQDGNRQRDGYLAVGSREAYRRRRKTNKHTLQTSQYIQKHTWMLQSVCLYLSQYKVRHMLVSTCQAAFYFHSHTLAGCLPCSFTHIRNFFHQSSTKRHISAHHDWFCVAKGTSVGGILRRCMDVSFIGKIFQGICRS